MKALAYGRVLGGGVSYGRGTPEKALAYGRVLVGGVFYRRGTPVKALAYDRVLGAGVFYGRGTPVKALAYGGVLLFRRSVPVRCPPGRKDSEQLQTGNMMYPTHQTLNTMYPTWRHSTSLRGHRGSGFES